MATPLSPGFSAETGFNPNITTTSLRQTLSSPGSSLTRRGLATTSSKFFTGTAVPIQGVTLKQLATQPEFLALESRQVALAARRVELLARQAAVSKELNALLSGPDGMLKDTLAHKHDTAGFVWNAQTWGYTAKTKHYLSPPRIAQADKSNTLGAKTKELNALEKEVAAGKEEERLLVEAMRRAAVSDHAKHANVNSLAAWRATYGSPSGALAASPGYATEWAPKGRFFGGPNSPLPHGHKKLNIFEGWASGAVDMKLGRDLK
jgi:hypothetical protein